MGHDIFGTNKAGEDIAYLRFTMNDMNSCLVYSLLDADECHAGVSGTGDTVTFSEDQIAEALSNYKQNHIRYPREKGFEDWQRNEIRKFFNNCLHAAKAEQTVQVHFG